MKIKCRLCGEEVEQSKAYKLWYCSYKCWKLRDEVVRAVGEFAKGLL